ncbi:hypothetical protein EDC50_3199, partial [Vulcaniibacterium tengchongense]
MSSLQSTQGLLAALARYAGADRLYRL